MWSWREKSMTSSLIIRSIQSLTMAMMPMIVATSRKSNNWHTIRSFKKCITHLKMLILAAIRMYIGTATRPIIGTIHREKPPITT